MSAKIIKIPPLGIGAAAAKRRFTRPPWRQRQPTLTMVTTPALSRWPRARSEDHDVGGADGTRTRLLVAERQLRQTVTAYRGPGAWHREDDRGRQVLHRRPHPDQRCQQRPAVGRAESARRAPRTLRHPRRLGGRYRGRREAGRSLRGHRATRPFLIVNAPHAMHG